MTRETERHADADDEEEEEENEDGETDEGIGEALRNAVSGVQSEAERPAQILTINLKQPQLA